MTRSHFMLLTVAAATASALVGVAVISNAGFSPVSALLGATLALAASSALYAWAGE